MSALETAKELGRMAATATLSKDVVDLFEKKVGLLTDQVSALETENANLKEKVADLEQQLDRLRPKSDLDAQAVRFLELLAHQSIGLSIEQIASHLGVLKVRAEYHRDSLVEAEMIGYHGAIVEMGRERYSLRRKGREYLAKHGRI